MVSFNEMEGGGGEYWPEVLPECFSKAWSIAVIASSLNIKLYGTSEVSYFGIETEKL